MCSDAVETANGIGSNGISSNGISNNANHETPRRQPRLPYHSIGDSWSNTGKFQIIESTLREGEQFANAFYDTGIFFGLGWGPRFANYN